VQHYLKEISASQVPGKIVMRDSLQQKSGKTGMENIAAVRTQNRPPQNNLWLPVFSPTVAHLVLPNLPARASNKGGDLRSFLRAANRPICHRKLLLATKHFLALCVFTGEEKIS